MVISLSLVLYAYRHGHSTEPVKIETVMVEAPVDADAHVEPERLPPLYKEYSASEEQLPQHNLDLPFPEGRHAKYIWFSNHVRGAY